MSFFMEKLKEALLMMLNFGDQVLQMMLNFVGQLLMKPVNFIGQGLISLKNFGWQVLLSLLNFFGQVPLALKNLVLHLLGTLKTFGWQMLLSLQNFFGQVPLALKNLVMQVLVTLKNLGVQVLVTLENIGGQALLALKNIGSQALVALDSFTWQVKNLCEQLVNWVDKVFPPETRVERINHWFHVALPYLIIALFLALFIYCCVYHGLLLNVMELLKTACGGLFNIMKDLFTCCWRSQEPVVKMMIAPGRGIMIARSIFENNPAAYFSNLRANPGNFLPL